ncbi:MAG: TonB family protein [Bryobacteraceae bacterium]
MNTTLVWSDILAYSLQVGLLVAVGAFVPALVRMRAAGARLLYWQLLLVACLVLPWVRPWHREVIEANVSVTTVITTVAAPTPAHFHIATGELLLYLLAAGVAARLAWLCVGFWRLHRYRRRAVPLEDAGVWAEVLLSAEISSPVTFGWRRPVILLPERFPQLSAAMRRAILCHEDLHVERCDWLFTVGEELVRAVLWFHPAIWWVLAEIQLAREQAVDARVVEITEARDPYVDALLEMAGARPELDLAPAPLFLRKRHLKQRVVEIIRETTMSKTRWITALAASIVFLAGACWLVTGAFPLAAEPQVVSDAEGVSVDPGGAQILHRSGVRYPEDAIYKGIQGTVVARVALDANGAVVGATSVSGPQELREAVLQSVFDWRFATDAARATRQVSVTFDLPKDAAEKLQETERSQLKSMYAHAQNPFWNRVIRSVVVSGISDQKKADLLARLPVHAGDTLTQELMINVSMAISRFDMRLGILTSPEQGGVILRIGLQVQLGAEPDGDSAAKPLAAPVESETGTAGTIRLQVSGNVQGFELISQSAPAYPPLAKQARIEGTVVLSALIGKDGHVQDLKVVRGHPLLVQAALDAVKDWVYKPTTINGQPMEVRTEISVNFTLPPSGDAGTPQRIRVGSYVQAANLITQVKPNYPPEAKKAGIQGVVELSAVIGKDGHVQDLDVVSGDPQLTAAAVDAVRQWIYRPTMLNGEPVEVKTMIDINFTLQ